MQFDGTGASQLARSGEATRTGRRLQNDSRTCSPSLFEKARRNCRAPEGTIDKELVKDWIDRMTPKQLDAVREFIVSGRLNNFLPEKQPIETEGQEQ